MAPAICGETLKRPGSFISTSVSRSSIITSETSPSAPPAAAGATVLPRLRRELREEVGGPHVDGGMINLPAIVMPHGGPYDVNATWGFDPEPQILAHIAMLG